MQIAYCSKLRAPGFEREGHAYPVCTSLRLQLRAPLQS